MNLNMNEEVSIYIGKAELDNLLAALTSHSLQLSLGYRDSGYAEDSRWMNTYSNQLMNLWQRLYRAEQEIKRRENLDKEN